MIAFPGMLVPAAEQAGMKVPPDADEFEASEFPHFHVFCIVQLGSSMPTPGAHWTNAEVIAEISDEEIKTITLEKLLPQLSIGYPLP